MKRDVGWGAPMAVAVAAVFGISQFGGRAPQGTPEQARTHTESSPRTKPPITKTLNRGVCDDLEKQLQAFFGVLDENSIVAPGSCADGDAPLVVPSSHVKDPNWKNPWDRAGGSGFKYVIATMDDPIYTHFALGFDRKAEAIQQAAADAGYVYDSSWLPWEPEEKNFQYLKDQDEADDRKDAREEQPGVLLFRKALSNEAPKSDDPYKNGLIVFVVGDDPTDGIHRTQFQNAMAWIAVLKHQAEQSAPYCQLPDSILGPSFSGSLPSLAALLNDIPLGVNGTSFPQNQKTPISIFSGTVTSGASVGWFTRATLERFELRFASFLPEDKEALDRYCRYLQESGFDIRHLAIVSEDETAFGAEEVEPNAQTSAMPHCVQAASFYYPRDISALRGAYQKESVFNSGAAAPAADPRRTLATDLSNPEGQQHDTIRTFSGDQTALSQEAILQQIVSFLRAHQSEYILLRSSNPLDQLFLSHYLRLAYGQGRIVILGADLLLRREHGAARLSGIMTLSSYPLYPWGADWTRAPGQAYSNIHSFPNDGTEGVYVAMRYLLHFFATPHAISCTPNSCPEEPLRAAQQLLQAGYRFSDVSTALVSTGHVETTLQFDAPDAGPFTRGYMTIRDGMELQSLTTCSKFPPPLTSFLPVDPCLPIPDYNTPFWLQSSGSASDVEAPPLWLSVLGATDFWPVAALNEQTLSQPSAGLLAEIGESLNALVRVFLIPEPPASCASKANGWNQWPPMPGSFGLAILGLCGWIAFHFLCCCFPSVMQKPNHRAYFVCMSETYRTHRLVLATASVSLSGMTTAIAWGCGAFSPDGAIFTPAWIARLFLFLGWFVPGLAVAVNVGRQAERAKSDWDLLWPPGAYIAGTLGFYCFSFVCCEASLGPANRIPTYWRAMHLSSGVSPVILLLAPAAGIYMWAWSSLQKLALFGPDRPVLPTDTSLTFDFNQLPRSWLRMFGQDFAGRSVERNCQPAPCWKLKFVIAVSVILSLTAYLLSGELPLRTLGQLSPSIFVCILIVVCVALTLTCAWQLLHAWIGLRQLLESLNRLRLRRSMAAIPGESWRSVWKVSGSVLDMRYKLLATQFESLAHLKNALTAPEPDWVWPWSTSERVQIRQVLADLIDARALFAEWYSNNLKESDAHDEVKLNLVQSLLATAAGLLMSKLLLAAWMTEAGPELCSDPCDAKESDTAPASDRFLMTVAELKPHIRYAEQFVCYVYLGFIQNTLGQIRSLVMSIAWLFVAIMLTTASYPLDPRPVISATAIVLSLVLGAVIVFVYAQMHRNPILSLITNTNPGELDKDFWFKLVGFGVGPAIGLLATLFPQIADFAYSWVQPSVGSIK